MALGLFGQSQPRSGFGEDVLMGLAFGLISACALALAIALIRALQGYPAR
jgi:hypothetical protein